MWHYTAFNGPQLCHCMRADPLPCNFTVIEDKLGDGMVRQIYRCIDWPECHGTLRNEIAFSTNGQVVVMVFINIIFLPLHCIVAVD